MGKRVWVSDDGLHQFDTKKELDEYEANGEYGDIIDAFITSQNYSQETERGAKALKTRESRVIARFLAWQDSAPDMEEQEAA